MEPRICPCSAAPLWCSSASLPPRCTRSGVSAMRVPDPEVGHPLVVAASALGPAEHGHAGVERAVVGVAVGQRVVEEHRVADGGLDLEAAPAEGLREARRAAAHRQREVHQEGEEPLRRAAAVVAEVVVRRVLLPAVVPHDLQLLGVAPRVEDGRVEAQHVGEARVHGAERRVGLDRAPREPPVGRGPRLALEPAALADLPEPTEQSRAEQCRAEQSKAWGGGVLTSSRPAFSFRHKGASSSRWCDASRLPATGARHPRRARRSAHTRPASAAARRGRRADPPARARAPSAALRGHRSRGRRPSARAACTRRAPGRRSRPATCATRAARAGSS
mmetsp:Transcript_27670/g.110793  ORF Transcript_27670/g.110793 Transcript_27670/m.110793 type:complete len:333 (-) Transcript_27670:756-1754(-)